MWTPPRPGRPGEWVSSALAVLALLIFVGGGAWWFQLWQGQKAQDEVRTAQLIGCLDAAQLALDPKLAINACRHEYADRVPALLRNSPYAFVPHRTTVSEAAVLGAMSAAASPTGRPTLSLSHPAEAAHLPDVRAGGSTEPSAGGNKTAARGAHPPVGTGKALEPEGAKTKDAGNPRDVDPGKRVGSGRSAAADPGPRDHASPPTAPPRNGHDGR